MEGLGSRQGRASSRYGSGPAAPVFNGPVRKWKKQWVSTSQSNHGGGGNKRNDTPPLLLCRWTPLSDPADDEPRKRRFRYAPVVEMEKGNGETLEKVSDDHKTSKKNESEGSASARGGIFEKDNTNDTPEEETQELGEDELQSNGGRRMVINWGD